MIFAIEDEIRDFCDENGLEFESEGEFNLYIAELNLLEEKVTGKELEHNLDMVHITANKNTVPGETRSANVTSGLRLGTPAVTTRGMGEAEMDIIAGCIADCLFSFEAKKAEVLARVEELVNRFPLYE